MKTEWRKTPAGAWVLRATEPAATSTWSNDIANAYRLACRDGWCGNPWGHPSRDFFGPTAEADAKAWAEAPFAETR